MSSRPTKTSGTTCWRERRLPVNVDPLKSELKDEEERARLARVFEQGLDQRRRVRAAAATARAAKARARAGTSGPWFLRSEHLFLIPGDSPIGYRLPLDSLPWVGARGRPTTILEARSVCAARRRCRSGSCDRRAVGAARAGARSRRRRRSPSSQPQATRRRPARRRDPDGALRRAAARTAARLHAAGRDDGGLSRSGRRDRGDRGEPEDAGHHRRHAAAVRSAAQPHQGHAGSRA